MLRAFVRFLRGDRGQDLAEYCLLTALLALIALGIIYHVSGGMQNLWGNAGAAISAGANSGAATSGQTGSSTPAQ